MVKNGEQAARLRLIRIEQWRRRRFERAVKSGAFEVAKHAVVLYTAASARAIGAALGTAQEYSRSRLNSQEKVRNLPSFELLQK